MRRLKFSTRWILLLVGLSAVWLTYARHQISRYEQTQRDIESLEKMGFIVDLESAEDQFFARFATRFDGFPTYIRLYQGPLRTKEVDELVEIMLRQQTIEKLMVNVKMEETDAAKLLPLSLHSLGISECSVGDTLATKASPTLEWLSFHRTRLNDISLRALGHLPALKFLDLTRTRVSDRSIEHLATFPNLEKVILRRCKVSEQGAERLRSLRPDVQVSWEPLSRP